MKTIDHYSLRRALAAVIAGLALGGNNGTESRADMYRMDGLNSGGGIPAQSVITGISQTSSNATLSWYGLQGWYGIEAATNMGGPWNTIASVAATDFAWTKTVANPDPTNSYFFRLNQANSFAGSGDCGSCHGDKYTGYLTTEHSGAYSSPSALTNFPLISRTIGYGQPSGFIDAATTPHLKNVGCESCHGAAGWHKNSDHSLIRPAVSLDPLICGSCHQGSAHPTYEEFESSPHAEVLDDLAYGFANGVYHRDTIIQGTNTLYGYYVTTNADLTLKTNATTGFVRSDYVPGSAVDNGRDRQATCGVCHSAATRMAMLSNYEQTLAGRPQPLKLPSANDAAAWGAACATCHDPHADYNAAQLRNPIRSTNFFTMATVSDKRNAYSTNFLGKVTTNIVYLNTTFNSLYDPTVSVCGQCHNTRAARWDGRAYGLLTNVITGVSVTNVLYVDIYTNATITQVFTNQLGVPYLTNTYNYSYVIGRYATNNVSTPTNLVITVGLTTNVTGLGRAPHPTSQYNVNIGIIQDDYLGGTNSPITHNHTRAPSQCATCHVPVYSSGVTNITGHTFALDTRGCLTSGCHGSVPSAFRSTQNSNSNSLYAVVALLNQWATNAGPALFGANYTKYKQNAWEYTAPGSLATITNAGPSAADQLKLPDVIKQARFNIYQVLGDGSWGIHNITFVSRLLSDANTKVSSAIIGLTNTAYFTASSTTGYAPFPVPFQTYGNGVTSYSWNFGDGGTSTAANPTYVYNSAGTNTVTLTVTTASATNTYVRTNYIKSYALPVVAFVGGPLIGEAPWTATFTNTSTSTNSVTAWRWTFGSQSITTNALVYTYTFTNPGTFNVALRATTPVGNVTATTNGYVIASTNAAFFQTTNATTGYAPLTNLFQVIGSGATNYSWNFGDGGTSTVAAPTHVYTSAGTNTVTLTVGTPGGPKTWTRTAYIKAYDLPVVSFTGTPTSGPAPLAVAFSNTSANIGSVTAWRWTINGLTFTNNPSVNYSFTNPTPASYSIQLRATTAVGTITTTNVNYISVTP
jgi:PKD repeat protein